MDFSYLDYSVMVPDDYVFNIPDDIEIINRYGYYIVLSPKNGSWLVLESENHIKIFKAIMAGNTIADIKNESIKNDDLQFVVSQIKGRHFEDVYERGIEDYFSLRIYLTNNCNLRCTHCFMYAGDKFNNELTVKEVLDIINISYEHGANKLILTGGEVCLADSFLPAIECAKNLGMYVQVLSNGTCWTDKLFDAAEKYIDDIQISVDGFDEKSNSLIRGDNTFRKSINTVEELVKRKVYTTIVTTPSYDEAKDSAFEYIKFGRNLVERFGNEYFCIMFGNEIINGRNIKAEKVKNIEYKKNIMAILEKIYPNYELTTFIRNHDKGRILANCGYGTVTISSTGDLYFCGRIFDVKKYGNIRNIPVDEVFELRRKAREKSQVYNLKPCKDCNVRYICGGGCRISNVLDVTTCDLDNNKEEFIRTCSVDEKENIFKMMIESNDYLLW